MKVKRNTLLLLACLVWSAAGFNILRIGLSAYPAYRAAGNYLLWADTIPMIGMLMIPKTCAYVWTVLIGYRAMKQECK